MYLLSTNDCLLGTENVMNKSFATHSINLTKKEKTWETGLWLPPSTIQGPLVQLYHLTVTIYTPEYKWLSIEDWNTESNT